LLSLFKVTLLTYADTQPILEPKEAKNVDFAKNMPALLSQTVENKLI
jgi:hypothetical protein